MRLRSGTVTHNSTYVKRRRRRNIASFKDERTRPHKRSLSFELQFIIIDEALHHRDVSLHDILTYLQVHESLREEVRRIIDSDADIRSRLLHNAVKDNDIEAVKVLLKNYGANINELGESGQTVLDTACIHGHIEMFQYLIKISGRLKRFCLTHSTFLSLLAVDNAHVALFGHLVDKYDAEF